MRAESPRRAASELSLDVQSLRLIPRGSAAELLSLAPGFYLAQHGGEGKAQQLFLRASMRSTARTRSSPPGPARQRRSLTSTATG
nr:hypothetical protein [Deltaproteobacteria bacterium]